MSVATVVPAESHLAIKPVATVVRNITECQANRPAENSRQRVDQGLCRDTTHPFANSRVDPPTAARGQAVTMRRGSATNNESMVSTLGGPSQMTHRLSLIMGLVVALPTALIPAARGDDSTTTISDSSSWKASEQADSADIRFKKPDGIVFTDQAVASKSSPAKS